MSDFDAAQALEALSEIHGPGNRATLKGENYCGVCNEKEPCSIRLLLAEVERAERLVLEAEADVKAMGIDVHPAVTMRLDRLVRALRSRNEALCPAANERAELTRMRDEGRRIAEALRPGGQPESAHRRKP